VVEDAAGAEAHRALRAHGVYQDAAGARFAAEVLNAGGRNTQEVARVDELYPSNFR
jgi:Zn-dependent oligopeptidase